MKTTFIWILKLLTPLLIIWVALTIWVEIQGPYDKWELGDLNSSKKALIIYDPDPFYNLDQQISESFARVLAKNNYKVTIATVAAIKDIETANYQLYVFCANTYNWQPDWAISQLIKKRIKIADKDVVAITLGAGSTSYSKSTFEQLLKSKKARLLDSKSFWLWKPNDESRMKESNVKVAVDMTTVWASEIIERTK